jgi:uncharacterized coiled-coil DUF342 family protein
MTKSEVSPNGQKSGELPPAGEGPSPELAERFRQFEASVDEAVRLIGELRQQKRGLETRLDEATRARAEAVQRIDALLDKIDGLL